MSYRDALMDQYFAAMIEIPQTAHEEFLKRIEQVPNQEINRDDSVMAKLFRSSTLKETIRAERKFMRNANYVHMVLCKENSRWF